MNRKAILIFCCALAGQAIAILAGAALARTPGPAAYAPSVEEIRQEQRDALDRLRRARRGY